MTITVLIGIHGNKAVEIVKDCQRLVLPPGQWMEINLHGDQALTIHETGDFVTAPSTGNWQSLVAKED